MNKFILEKIGITNQIVNDWRKKGLKITYPIKENHSGFISSDKELYYEHADKFFPLFTKKENRLYIKSPERFKEDLLKNAKVYRKFVDFIYSKHTNLKKLNERERFVCSLCLLYLFIVVTDNHYYHWDRYLSLEDYPETPLGYWWKKIKDVYNKYDKTKISASKMPPDFLLLISRDKNTIAKIKRSIDKSNIKKLDLSLKSLKTFEDAQQKEVENFVEEGCQNVNLRASFPLLDYVINRFSKFTYPNAKPIIKLRKMNKIDQLRYACIPQSLECLDKEIFSEFEREIKRWIN